MTEPRGECMHGPYEPPAVEPALARDDYALELALIIAVGLRRTLDEAIHTTGEDGR